MNDKQFDLFAIAVALALAVWYFLSRKQSQSQMAPGEVAGAFPSNVMWPQNNVQPQAYAPPSLGQVELNINNPALSALTNQYIPLFGMVGIAQGTYYQ
ncbi:MAG: hypothetical protein U7M05_12115 [Candidatus Igneacidithiobacillus chanchocoensis]